jgi:hypothetical protein
MRVVVMEPAEGGDVIALFESWERSDDFLDNENIDWEAEDVKRSSRMVRD